MPISKVLALLALTVCLHPAGAAEPLAGLSAAFRPLGPSATAVENPAGALTGGGTGGGTPGLRLVLTSPGRNLASIDGQIVRVGELVGGLRVTQINAQGVVLAGEDGTRERLPIHAGAAKQLRPATSLPSPAGSATTGQQP